jgi:hypothetical protein
MQKFDASLIPDFLFFFVAGMLFVIAVGGILFFLFLDR